MINVELPVVEVAETSTDFIFLLEDDTYLHFEFQTVYNKKDLIRFAMYDLRLYARDKRPVQTVIVYSSDVKKTDDSLNIGSLKYAPSKVMMYEYDGNTIYEDLEMKLKSRQDLTDVDMLNLIFLPLMRNDVPKRELTEKSIELAQTIPDKTKRDTCIASVFAFSFKYLSDEDIKRILEVLKMANIDTMLDMLFKDALNEHDIEIARNLLQENIPIEVIAKTTALDIEVIKALQEQLEQHEEN